MKTAGKSSRLMRLEAIRVGLDGMSKLNIGGFKLEMEIIAIFRVGSCRKLG